MRVVLKAMLHLARQRIHHALYNASTCRAATSFKDQISIHQRNIDRKPIAKQRHSTKDYAITIFTKRSLLSCLAKQWSQWPLQSARDVQLKIECPVVNKI
jgi:hypothetical protein